MHNQKRDGRGAVLSQGADIDANVWPKAKVGSGPESQILDSGKRVRWPVVLPGAGWDRRFLGNSGRKGPQQVLAAAQPPAESRMSLFAICSLAANPEEQIVSQQRQQVSQRPNPRPWALLPRWGEHIAQGVRITLGTCLEDSVWPETSTLRGKRY